MLRALRTIAAALGVGAVFAAALVGGTLLHFDRTALRRAVAVRVTQGLAPVLEGRIVVERIGVLTPWGVGGVDARVEDPDGQRVLRVTGVEALLDTGALVRSLRGGDPIVVNVEALVIEDADVSLDADDAGRLRLARAFVPAKHAEQTPSKRGPGVRVAIAPVRLIHARVHGKPPGAPVVDAEVSEAAAALHLAPGSLALDLAHAGVVSRDIPPGTTIRGTLDAGFAQPSSQGGDQSVRAYWRGEVDGIPTAIEAAYEGGTLGAVVDVAEATPEQIRAIWPASPFTEPASAHVDVTGVLPYLLVDAHARVGAGKVRVTGPVQLSEPLRASARVVAIDVDARALAPKAPHTSASAFGRVSIVASKDGSADGVVVLEVPRSTVGTTLVPAARVLARLALDSTGALRADADVAVDEPGAPAHATVHLVPKGASFALSFDASAEAARLDGVPRLGPVARGSARVRARGSLDLAASQLDATLDGSATGVRTGPLSLASATVSARVRGPLAAPSVDADVQGADLAAGRFRFGTLHADAHGPARDIPIHVALGGGDTGLEARATLSLAGGVALDDATLDARRGGESAHAHAGVVRVAGGELAIEELAIEGLGGPLHGSVHASHGSLRIEARSRGLDLARVGRLTGVADLAGRVAVDVDATIHPRSAQGRLALDLTQGAFGQWKDASAHLEAKLDERHVSGQLDAKLGDVGSLDVRVPQVEIGPAGPLDGSSWRTAWGAADADAHVDLARLAARMPPKALPFTVAGVLDLKAHAARDSASDETPDVDVAARTAGLTIAGASVPKLSGSDVGLHVHVDGRTGTTSVDAQVAEGTRTLVTLVASSSDVPYARIFTADAPLGDALMATRFRATVTVPATDVATLPAALGTRGMHGMLDARLDWSGAALEPTVDLRASVAKAQAVAELLTVPLDLDVSAHYDGARASAVAHGMAHGKTVLEVGADVDARAREVLAAAGEPPWKASAYAKLDGFPLQSIAVLDQRQVRGGVTGTVRVDGLHDDARASAALVLSPLTVGDEVCRDTRVDVRFDGKALDATARVQEEDGFAQVAAHLGAKWGAALRPTGDDSTPADLSLQAQRFRADVLLPFVATVFNELDGRIDADVKVHVDPRERTIRPNGTLSLDGGVFELIAMGGEIRDAKARVVLAPDGVVRVEGVTGRGLTGHFDAAATARFQGLDFTGVRGTLTVPKRDPFPVVLDGSPVGTFDGRVDFTADRKTGGLYVGVDVPAMRLQLPSSTSRDVQHLGPIEGVRTGVTVQGAFQAEGLDVDAARASNAPRGPRSPVYVALRLGHDVEVLRSDPPIDVHLSGGPTFTVADRTTAKGQITLPQGGTLDVKGKTFTIDYGTVTFVDDPSNPQIVLRASWKASDPDNTLVLANFVGPLKTAKLTLGSEPKIPDQEILSLILYGTRDESASNSSATSGQGGAATGAAGSAISGTVNQALGGVNQALEGLGLQSSVATKIDTSQTTPRPEVEVQIARDLTLQVAAVLGIPPPGTNPDRYLFTVGYRFLRHWSLETTVGDQGTSILDVVWQRRY